MFNFGKLFTLKELYDSNHELTNLRANKCKTLRIGHVNGVYLFLVRCKESYSNPKGHFVSVRFVGYDSNKVKDRQPSEYTQPNLVGMQVKCSCEAFHYWGSDYWSTQLGYGLGTNENRFPVVRDPNMERFVCKHVSRVYKNTLNSIRMKQLESRYGNRNITEDDIRRSMSRFNKAGVEDVVLSGVQSLGSRGVSVEELRDAVYGRGYRCFFDFLRDKSIIL